FVKGTEPSSVSEKFDELDGVSNLSASYNDEGESISASWDYDDDMDVSFEVAYKVEDGEYQSLTITEDKEVEISSVEPGSSYTIKVVVVSNEEDLKSPAETVTVDLVDEDEEEDEEIPEVSSLSATYNEDNQSLDVTWEYNGPDAQFEIDINGDKQTVQAQKLQVNGVRAGRTYSIHVTPVV